MFKKIGKLVGSCLLAVSLAVGMTVSVPAAVDVAVTADSFPVESDTWQNWPKGPDMLAVTACLMDGNTGEILYAKGMDAQRFPASITKIMTALVVVENADLNAQVAFTQTGLADAYGGSSNINPQLGEVFTVDQMLQMLLVKSANDVATQLAEAVGGSVDAFAAMMNQKAAELGCTNTHFANASGLENDDHYTSAHDMALIMRAAIQHDRIREIMHVQSIVIPETNVSGARAYDTHLQMLVPENPYYYEGAMGGKTGYTPISGCTLVMYAVRGDRILIGVVMGSRDSNMDSNLICADMADIMNYGFDSFSNIDMAPGYPCVSGGLALVPNGTDASAVAVIPNETPDGMALSYQYAGQNVGSGLMTKETYDAWQLALHPTPEPTATPQTGVENNEKAVSPERGMTEKTEGSKHKTSGKIIIMYAIIGILLLAIVASLLLIIFSSDMYQKKKHRRKKKQGRIEIDSIE